MMVKDHYEVWLCLADNACTQGADSFCFVFDETTQTFKPWGLNSNLEILPFAIPMS